MKQKSTLTLAVMLTLGAGSAANAALLSEIFYNPPGTDGGKEFFELTGNPGESLSGLTFLVVEGDTTGSGLIDVAISLDGFSLGSSGLFLWRDDVSTLSPAPDAGTSVNVTDFNPDLENGTQSYLLVSGFTGSVGYDLDTNDDGTIDAALPWSGVSDAVSVSDGGGTDSVYMDDVGFGSPVFPFNPQAVVRVATTGSTLLQWTAVTVTGSGTGPFEADLASYLDGSTAILSGGVGVTPGSANFTPVPEPEQYAAMAGAGLVAFALLRSRLTR